jgi:hypothetical protein
MPMIHASPAANPSTGTRADRACAACPHDRDAHDAIGTRFCSATNARGLNRGCVCVGAALASGQRGDDDKPPAGGR